MVLVTIGEWARITGATMSESFNRKSNGNPMTQDEIDNFSIEIQRELINKRPKDFDLIHEANIYDPIESFKQQCIDLIEEEMDRNDNIKMIAKEYGIVLKLKDGRVAYFKDIETGKKALVESSLKDADLIEHEVDKGE